MPTPTQTTTTTSSGLKVKTHVKAGTGMPFKHNETLVRLPRPATGLKVKTGVKAGTGVVHPDGAAAPLPDPVLQGE